GSAGHGARGAVQIVGTAGIGTSTVAAFWVHEHRDRFPDGQLYVRMGGSYRTPPSITTVLLRLLQDLGVPASEIPQYDLPTLTRVYRSVTADRALVIGVDDVPPELDVTPLIPDGRDSLLVVTARTENTFLTALHVPVVRPAPLVTANERRGPEVPPD
ncbi:hypothetical protein ACFQ1S_45710, partial [Kibdelosporangium lantanae]